jgi:hypothetical protein
VFADMTRAEGGRSRGSPFANFRARLSASDPALSTRFSRRPDKLRCQRYWPSRSVNLPAGALTRRKPGVGRARGFVATDLDEAWAVHTGGNLVAGLHPPRLTLAVHEDLRTPVVEFSSLRARDVLHCQLASLAGVVVVFTLDSPDGSIAGSPSCATSGSVGRRWSPTRRPLPRAGLRS